MPHADDQSQDLAGVVDQAAQDDVLIQKALDPQGLQLDVFDRELIPGEKADDAVDYEDISDDDLAEEEYVSAPATANIQPADEDEDEDLFGGMGDEDGMPGMEQSGETGGDNLDDLFGGTSSSPPPEADGVNRDGMTSFDFAGDDEVFGQPIGHVQGEMSPSQLQAAERTFAQEMEQEMDLDTESREEPTEMELLQQRLFAQSNLPPAPPENQEELLASLWPKFERNTIPRFMDLLPPKRARYVGKVPSKQPKLLQPTKISLEIAPDHEKSFKFSAGGAKRKFDTMEENGLVRIEDVQAIQEAEEDERELDSDYEDEAVGGVTWQDFQVICADWDIANMSDSVEDPESPPPQDDDDLYGPDPGQPSAKRRKLEQLETNVLNTPQFTLPSLHDLEHTMKRIAKSVALDLNDPYLLVDENQTAIERFKKKSKKIDTTQGNRLGLSKAMSRRYNISNDEAYDLLKENHQSRVRSTLGQPRIVHSMPASRLQWPYYKTKLARQEARSFHRPAAHFTKGEPITFQQPPFVKRKHIKGKDVKVLYNNTEDLSLRDNSHMLLMEYSEEHPDLMQNFGMGSRLINYYRKKALDDPERPKLDIGELSVLLPQDKSPFSVFGHIDPGETTPAIYNGLYRAPVFEQTAKSSDFLMIRSSTGATGGRWYMRSIEYVRTVGQLFPSQEVPRPNGRKVSTAAKNRVKMIAYRLMRRAAEQKIQVFDVTEHVSDSIEMMNRQKADMQSRQKMKEFLSYNKEAKLWGMPNDLPVPDEETTRSALPPEDACLVEAVQVGQQHLEDAGFTGEGDDNDDADEEGRSVEQQLAPWLTTKNFLTACAGKAMLQLHGEGDPSGRGEAFSFLKTSMKGGFKALGESVEDKIDAKKLKENNGHSYNVAKQAKAYEESIRRIWDAQHQSLSSTIEHSDAEMDVDDVEDRGESLPWGMTPRSEAQTPSAFRRRDDETMSQFSKFSTDSQSGRILRITRTVMSREGTSEEKEEIVRNPRVIRQYLKRRQAMEADNIDLDAVKSGDVADSVAIRQKIELELNRLERNKERRLAREKQKAGAGMAGDAGSPNADSPAQASGKGSTTGRRLCPLLNGTMKPQDSFSESAFSMSSTPAP